MEDFIDQDTKQVTRAYGVIQKIFEHAMHKGEDAPKRVVIECVWYEYVGINPVSLNPQVRFNPNWKSHYVFLDSCVASACVFWPSDPFGDRTLLDVVTHHDHE